MKSIIKTACASVVSAAALFAAASPASAAFDVYYVEFYMGSSLIGLGEVGCADMPFEYLLLWGSDQGEMVVVGRENCPSLPPPFGS